MESISNQIRFYTPIVVYMSAGVLYRHDSFYCMLMLFIIPMMVLQREKAMVPSTSQLSKIKSVPMKGLIISSSGNSIDYMHHTIVLQTTIIEHISVCSVLTRSIHPA